MGGAALMTRTRLEYLIDEAAKRREEFDAARARLDKADQAVLEERFRDVPRYARGDVILVKRKLFGRVQLWPARVESVNLRYGSGTFGSGEPWEYKIISYSVRHLLKDGSWDPEDHGYEHSETAGLAPASATEGASHD
jgi:hypothetical protein